MISWLRARGHDRGGFVANPYTDEAGVFKNKLGRVNFEATQSTAGIWDSKRKRGNGL